MTKEHGIIEDCRTNQTHIESRETARFVVGRDTCLSGWGPAENGDSYYALAVECPEDEEILLQNFEDRDEMRDAVAVTGYTQLVARCGAGDHMSIRDRADASRWYEPGGFAERKHPKAGDIPLERIIRG